MSERKKQQIVDGILKSRKIIAKEMSYREDLRDQKMIADYTMVIDKLTAMLNNA